MNIVFVYGTLKEGEGNHRLLETAEFIREDQLKGWDMYSLGGFPAITQGSGEIYGELYAVDDATMQRLDVLEGYPSFYNRMLVKTRAGIRAWVYYIEQLEKRMTLGKLDTGVWNGATE